MEFLQLSEARYSLRKFSDRPVEAEKLATILEAGRSAPTAHNLQPQRIFVLQSPEALEKAKTADGFIFGSPVHYAAASGSMTGFLDRLFMSGGAALKYKPAAAVVSARRAGTTAALDQLQKYMTFGNMLLVGSQYWTMVHGKTPEDVRRDEEGLQTMRVLARNMAWVLKCLEAGKAAGVSLPEGEERIYTSFIR